MSAEKEKRYKEVIIDTLSINCFINILAAWYHLQVKIIMFLV